MQRSDNHSYIASKFVETLGREAAQRAVTLLSAQPCPKGQMTVVMGSEAGGTMVHEACGHGLEGDLVQKGLSAYAGKIGQQVASENTFCTTSLYPNTTCLMALSKALASASAIRSNAILCLCRKNRAAGGF